MSRTDALRAEGTARVAREAKRRAESCCAHCQAGTHRAGRYAKGPARFYHTIVVRCTDGQELGDSELRDDEREG